MDNTVLDISRAGVYVDSSNHDLIEQNSLFANDQSSLEDPVAGILMLGTNPNDNVAAPKVTTAVATSTSTLVSGSVTGTANTEYRIELFVNNISAAVNQNVSHLEGQTYVGYVNVTTNSAGKGQWAVTLPTSLATGQYVTATSTNISTGDTSEFSSGLVVSRQSFTADVVMSAGDTERKHLAS
jgi:hypothetical protein